MPSDSGRVAVAIRRRPAVAEVHGQDTGVGIAAGDLAHVFDRFRRADPARTRDHGGTGLGLGIARRIAVWHGGVIELASTSGQGTTVSIRIPVIT